MHWEFNLYSRGGRSACHGSQWRITRSRTGGFLSKNCEACGKPSRVGPRELPVQACLFCGKAMVAYIGHDKNYWYSCLDCDADYRIADFVPYWDQLFDNYCGLAAPGDNGTQAN